MFQWENVQLYRHDIITGGKLWLSRNSVNWIDFLICTGHTRSHDAMDRREFNNEI